MLRGEKNFLFGHLTDTSLKPDTRLPCAETLQPTVRALAVKTARLRTARFGGRSENTKLPSLHLHRRSWKYIAAGQRRPRQKRAG